MNGTMDDGSGAPKRPHRGGMILAFGIIGFFCLIFGILAWVMGAGDLKEMHAGRMDSSGEGSTNAGRICGMISVILSIVVFVITLATGGMHASFKAG